ncbi:MAG: HEPN domain-containing protein [Pseudobdellovibrio sp.]
MISQQKKLYKKEYAQELLCIAQGDLESASVLLKSQYGRKENCLYMIQQSVEKSIKSVLIFEEIAFPLVHDLGALIALLPEDKTPPGGFDLIALNPYASIRRHEQGSVELSADEMQTANQSSVAVVQWAQAIIKTNGE